MPAPDRPVVGQDQSDIFLYNSWLSGGGTHYVHDPGFVRDQGGGALTVMYFYKLAEYMRNRYCDRDVRLVLIYKTALFHLLSEEGK